MTRVSVPVSEDTKLEVTERPDELGLDPNSSASERWAELLEAGVAALRAQVRQLRREEAYAEHNASSEYQQALEVSGRAAFEAGGF